VLIIEFTTEMSKWQQMRYLFFFLQVKKIYLWKLPNPADRGLADDYPATMQITNNELNNSNQSK
jgi:hypothetical protein